MSRPRIQEPIRRKGRQRLPLAGYAMSPKDFMAMLHTVPFVRHYLPSDDDNLFNYISVYMLLRDHGAPDPKRTVFIPFILKVLNPR
jgi:hypothetical protein